jgi:succinate dehydrogenase / fumarate reductase, cytochrome b subunit
MQQKLVSLFTTPFGRKNLEAGTGALLLLFMVEHFVANLMLLINDPEPYRWYTETMGRAILVRGMEVGLFLLFAIHIGIGLMMRLYHRKLQRKHKNMPRPKNLSTRFVGWTGMAILIFLALHLWRFFYPNRILGQTDFDLYDQARLAFSSVWYTGFYVICMIALASHLQHGIKSALFSFKFIPPQRVPMARKIGAWVGVGTSIGLAYIAVHLYVISLLR